MKATKQWLLKSCVALNVEVLIDGLVDLVELRYLFILTIWNLTIFFGGGSSLKRH